jgi:CRP-like cAMP-binding protein
LEEIVLKAFIDQLHLLPQTEWEAFSNIWQPYSCKRKTLLTKAGDTERYLYFVLDGVQRSFYADDVHKEATIVFTYPPSFSGVADSFLTQTPSLYFFETLTASKFLRTTYAQVDHLMQQHAAIKTLVLKATALTLKGVLKRMIDIQCFSAEEKYKALLRRSPHVLQIIPHKYLASYLGIDAATFSKLLNTVPIE